jgi:hypothetical protein
MNAIKRWEQPNWRSLLQMSKPNNRLLIPDIRWPRSDHQHWTTLGMGPVYSGSVAEQIQTRHGARRRLGNYHLRRTIVFPNGQTLILTLPKRQVCINQVHTLRGRVPIAVQPLTFPINIDHQVTTMSLTFSGKKSSESTNTRTSCMVGAVGLNEHSGLPILV